MSDHIKVRVPDRIFLNSKVVFTEYIDVIRSPYFLFLSFLVDNYESVHLKEPFDLTPILNTNTDELLQWYYERSHQNCMLDLLHPDYRDSVRTKDVDLFLNKQLEATDFFVANSNLLKFYHVIHTMFSKDTSLVDEMQIWYPYNNPVIRKDVLDLFQFDNIRFVHGDITSVLRETPPGETTYIFSDITNILVLEELNRLELSSVLIPVDFDYNRIPETRELKVDLNRYREEYTFKANFFIASGVD